HAVYELMADSDFQTPTMHHQPAHGAPALRTGMRPQQYSPSASSVVADSTYQVRSPDPASGKQHDRIHLRIVLHLPKSRDRFFLRSDHDLMPHQLQPRPHQRLLRAGND